jgi:uncharacterized protein (DUF608 family)
MSKAVPYSLNELFRKQPQRTFIPPNLLQIAMPQGGIGAGCICLNGYGGLQDFSIHNRPATSAMEEGNTPGDAGFALLHILGEEITRLVEGPLPVEKIYNQGIKNHGFLGGSYEGLPRFRDCAFKGEYPFGYVTLSDPDLPFLVGITGFSPFIPLDDKNSSIPALMLEYSLKNLTDQPINYEFSYHLSHLAYGGEGVSGRSSRNAAIPGIGVYFYNTDNALAESFGSAALGVIGYSPVIKAMWLRGNWFDAISALWRETSSGNFKSNDGGQAGLYMGRNGGSILLSGSLLPGQSITYPIVITWYFPNIYYQAGGESVAAQGRFSGSFIQDRTQPAWRPYYVSQWGDAQQVLTYIYDHYSSLRQRTQAFHDALFTSTLPTYVLDAISANLAIIKSPTLLREENGNLWGWEGCKGDHGCGSGSCTHVWNYAQALPHLFPQLERSLREQELERSMNEFGHVNFRAALPDGPTHHNFHAAADGQLGGIMKVYREWQISGDRAWLEKIVPLAKRSMDYAIRTWDPRQRGVVEELHHNTYDIEFWGADGMHASFYLGALAAIAALSREIGHFMEADFYQELAEKGVHYIDEQLWNGEYYEQKVNYLSLRDTSLAKFVASLTPDSPEEDQMLKAEGPKYQYGAGCISDGVMGAWLAWVCGLETPQSKAKISSNLRAIFQNNFKNSLWEHANPQRPGYAIGDEPGLLLCTWPKGGKPSLPFIYSDEVWTGIEYRVASHLIAEGMVVEGLTVVKALRSRYEGHVRNPWNEYEYGNYYARAMASYALLQALSGFRYSAPEKKLYFGLQLLGKIDSPQRPIFQTFFSTATGWGTIRLTPKHLIIDLAEGELIIDKLVLLRDHQQIEICPCVHAHAGKKARIKLPVE